jgi:hypothetical protein
MPIAWDVIDDPSTALGMTHNWRTSESFDRLVIRTPLIAAEVDVPWYHDI